MPATGHIHVTQVHVPGLPLGLGFQVVVDGGCVFCGVRTETAEGPAVVVFD